jgi:hypothetical protein
MKGGGGVSLRAPKAPHAGISIRRSSASEISRNPVRPCCTVYQTKALSTTSYSCPVQVACLGYSLPVDGGLAVLQVIGETAGRFGYDLKGPRHCIDGLAVAREILECHSCREGSDRIDVCR